MTQDEEGYTVPFTRRQFMQTTLAGSALLGLSGLNAHVSSASPRRMPNIIFILCDDLGYQDLSCYGSPLISTPRIDRMAEEGVKFTDFYSAAPVCTPSRASFLTGCYPVRVGLESVLFPNAEKGLSGNEITIAGLLRQRGYATACVGKWHLGDRRQFLPCRHGFDRYFGIPYSNDMTPTPLMRNDDVIEEPAVQETLTERYTSESLEFIAENKDRPFFLYLAHTFPHVPLHASPRFLGKSKRGLYGDVVECIDWSTGEILDSLVALGIDRDTLVIFTSDNGPWLQKGEDGGSALPLRDGKFATWEGGMREPCVMRWPGKIRPQSTCSELATMMDLYPTFAGLAGAQVPTDRVIDGKDILPLILGEKNARSPHEALFYYRGKRLQAVRSGRWKLAVGYMNWDTGQRFPAELYDLQTDISETNDIASQHPDVVVRLEEYAERCREDLGDELTKRVGRNVRPPGMVAAFRQ